MTELHTEMRYFSATGSTRRIVDAAAEGLGGVVTLVDITCAKDRMSAGSVDADLLILACPVYGERIPGFIRRYMEGLKGKGTNLAVIAVYGNVSSGISLAQFTRITRGNHFNLIGAGAFVGQHSFANPTNQVGWGRPDRCDLDTARKFGVALALKIYKGDPQAVKLPPARLPLFIQYFPENAPHRLKQLTRLLCRLMRPDVCAAWVV